MAKRGYDTELPAMTYTGDWRNSEHEKAFAELRAKAANVDPDGDLTDAMIRFQVADGYAFYVVVKNSPLTLSHVRYADNYAVHDAMIRGLTRSDVADMVRREQAMKRLFGG